MAKIGPCGSSSTKACWSSPKGLGAKRMRQFLLFFTLNQHVSQTLVAVGVPIFVWTARPCSRNTGFTTRILRITFHAGAEGRFWGCQKRGVFAIQRKIILHIDSLIGMRDLHEVHIIRSMLRSDVRTYRWTHRLRSDPWRWQAGRRVPGLVNLLRAVGSAKFAGRRS